MGLFSILRPRRPGLQLYGKLPIAKDYLRIGLGDEGGTACRDWLDRCFSSTVERGTSRLLRWPVAYILGAQKGDALVGCMWNSHDAGGQRSFPFTLAVQRQRRALDGDAKREFEGPLRTWQKLDSLRETALNFENGAELMLGLRGIQVLQDGQQIGLSENVSLATWCRQLWPENELNGLRAALQELREAAAGAHCKGVRLGLVPGLDWIQQVQAWWLALQASGWLPASMQRSIFFQRTDGWRHDEERPPAAIFVSRLPLHADDADRLCDLRGAINFPGWLNLGQATGAPQKEIDLESRYPLELSLAQALRAEFFGNRTEAH